MVGSLIVYFNARRSLNFDRTLGQFPSVHTASVARPEFGADNGKPGRANAVDAFRFPELAVLLGTFASKLFAVRVQVISENHKQRRLWKCPLPQQPCEVPKRKWIRAYVISEPHGARDVLAGQPAAGRRHRRNYHHHKITHLLCFGGVTFLGNITGSSKVDIRFLNLLK